MFTLPQRMPVKDYEEMTHIHHTQPEMYRSIMQDKTHRLNPHKYYDDDTMEDIAAFEAEHSPP